MKIVNISDIEDIVLAKYEIDTNNPACEGRSNLNDFIKDYCTLTDTLIIDNEYISFNYVELFDHKYLFISDDKNTKKIIYFLSSIQYNYDNLQLLQMNEIITDNFSYFIHNNKYYKVNDI